MAHEAGDVEGGEPGLGGGGDGGAVLQQQLHHLDAVLLAGDVQRRETIQGSRVHLGEGKRIKDIWQKRFLHNTMHGLNTFNNSQENSFLTIPV